MTAEFDMEKIKQICEKHGISFLGLFGSYARGDNTAASDVDLLAKYSIPVSLFGIARAQNEFEALLGKPVDLVMEKNLKPRLRPFIERDLKVIYEKR